MMQFDRITMGKQAKELGFVRDTLEKVCRLVEVLQFMEQDEVLSETLALKGGTAINLTLFDLPRLSVDIDLDYARNIPRNDMITEREVITSRMSKYMAANGYVLSGKSKNYHALDSFVYEYQNSGGRKDNLKIEINYILRCHVLPVTRRRVELPWRKDGLAVLSVAPIEIFGAKIVALLTRTAPRDLYDVHNMIKYGLFDELELDMLRRCVVFYSAVGGEKPPQEFAFEKIERVTKQRIKTDLYPVLRHGERFDLEIVQKEVKEYLSGFLIPTMGERMFWQEFEKGAYYPEYIFDFNELKRVQKHPMAIWKCQGKHRQCGNVKMPKREGRAGDIS